MMASLGCIVDDSGVPLPWPRLQVCTMGNQDAASACVGATLVVTPAQGPNQVKNDYGLIQLNQGLGVGWMAMYRTEARVLVSVDGLIEPAELTSYFYVYDNGMWEVARGEVSLFQVDELEQLFLSEHGEVLRVEVGVDSSPQLDIVLYFADETHITIGLASVIR